MKKLSVVGLAVGVVISLSGCDDKVPLLAEQCGSILAFRNLTDAVDITSIKVEDASGETNYGITPDSKPEWVTLGYTVYSRAGSGSSNDVARCLVSHQSKSGSVQAFQLSPRETLTPSNGNPDSSLADALYPPNLSWNAPGYKKRKGSVLDTELKLPPTKRG